VYFQDQYDDWRIARVHGQETWLENVSVSCSKYLVFLRSRLELVKYLLPLVSMTSDSSLETLKFVDAECSSYRRALPSRCSVYSIFARRQPCEALHCKKIWERYAEYKGGIDDIESRLPDDPYLSTSLDINRALSIVKFDLSSGLLRWPFRTIKFRTVFCFKSCLSRYLHTTGLGLVGKLTFNIATAERVDLIISY